MKRSALILIAAAALARIATADAPAVDALIAAMPAESPAATAPAFAAVVAAGPDAVAALCAKLVPQGEGDDANVRFALQGLALHASRPQADKDAAVFTAGVSAALARAANPEVRAFLATLLRTAGDASGVPALEKLAADAASRDVALAALVAQASPEADAALLRIFRPSPAASAAAPLKALGDRRIAAATAEIEKRSSEAGLAAPALYALARIGAPSSRAAVLRLAGNDAWTEVLRYAAELRRAGKAADTAAVARDVLKRTPAVPLQFRCGALAMLTDAAGDAALPELKAAMADSDRVLRHAAASALARLPDGRGAALIAEGLRGADDGLKADFLRLLGGCPAAAGVAAPAVTACLTDTNQPVREAAVSALLKLRGPAAAKDLIDALPRAQDADSVASLANGLKRLPDDAVAAPCLAACASATGAVRIALLPVAALRAGAAGQDLLLKAFEDADPAVRRAALAAAESAGAPALLPKILAVYTGAADNADRGAARKCAVAIARDVADPAARVEPVLQAMASAQTAPRKLLIELLPMLGGARALEAVTAALGSADVRETAVRALAAWPDAPALPKLMELARAKDAGTTPILATRGALRIATQDASLSGAARMQVYRDVLAISPARDEKLQLLAGLADLATPAAAALAATLIADEAVKADAAATVARIVLPEKDRKKNKPLGAAEIELLRKAAPALADSELRKRVEKALPK